MEMALMTLQHAEFPLAAAVPPKPETIIGHYIYVREDFESKSGQVREEKGEEGKKKHKNAYNKGNARVQTFITRGVRKGLGGREIREQKNGGEKGQEGGG